MAGTTPPFGMLLFIVKGVASPDTKFSDIVKYGIPFLICDVIIMAFPVVALWLPTAVFSGR